MLKKQGKWRRPEVTQYIQRYKKKTEITNETIYDVVVAKVLDEQGLQPLYAPAHIWDEQQVWDALENFSPERNFKVDKKNPHIKAGIGLAYAKFAKPKDANKIVPKALSECPALLHPEKSAGLSMLLANKGEAMQYSLDRAYQILAGKKKPNPVIFGTRTQSKTPVPYSKKDEYVGKTRLVWAYPCEMTLLEAKFVPQLNYQYSRRFTPMAFAMSKESLGMHMASYIQGQGQEVYALDYSKFDSTINSYFIDVAFHILETWFDLSDTEDYLAWKQVKHYFKHCPIVMPDGHLYTGKQHGVPSGSYFTQLIDSVVNCILIGALNSSMDLGIPSDGFFMLGDDVIMTLKRAVPPEWLSKFLRDVCGITAHPEKCEVGKVEFLGYEWKFGSPHRKTSKILAKLVWPENKNWKLYKNKSRTIKRATAVGRIMCVALTCTEAFQILPDYICGNDFSTSTLALQFTTYRANVPPESLPGFEKFRREHLMRNDWNEVAADPVIESLL